MKRHKHAWVAVATTEQKTAYDPKTIALYRCDGCGATKTRKLRGVWTTADLNPPKHNPPT